MGIEFLEKKEEIYMPPAMFSYTDKPHKYGFDSGISFPVRNSVTSFSFNSFFRINPRERDSGPNGQAMLF